MATRSKRHCLFRNVRTFLMLTRNLRDNLCCKKKSTYRQDWSATSTPKSSWTQSTAVWPTPRESAPLTEGNKYRATSSLSEMMKLQQKCDCGKQTVVLRPLHLAPWRPLTPMCPFLQLVGLLRLGRSTNQPLRDLNRSLPRLFRSPQKEKPQMFTVRIMAPEFYRVLCWGTH